MLEDVEGDPLSIVFRSHKKNRPGFPLTLRAKSLEQKSNWSRDLAAANQGDEDIAFSFKKSSFYSNLCELITLIYKNTTLY